jgi:hypothetical protein
MKANAKALAIGATIVLGMGACDGSASEVLTDRFEGTLAVDVRDAIDVAIAVRPDKTADVRLAFKGQTFGLVGKDTLTAKGRAEPFPEAATEMYVASWSYSMPPTSPCKGEPVSLALSLVRRSGNNRVGGSLAAYCGAEKWHGVPVRLLRLSGELPPS